MENTSTASINKLGAKTNNGLQRKNDKPVGAGSERLNTTCESVKTCRLCPSLLFASVCLAMVHQCESLFWLLDDGDGKISFQEFVEGTYVLGISAGA